MAAVPLPPPPHATRTIDVAEMSAKQAFLNITQLTPGSGKGLDHLQAGFQGSAMRNTSYEFADISPKRTCSQTKAAMAAVSVRNMRGPSPT
jgi:hypothetical protein